MEKMSSGWEPANTFFETLVARLLRPLPGREAWLSCAPELSYGRHAGPAPRSARGAAVLVLFYQRGAEWHLPLMLRPDHMFAHASQVSFPGGLIEEGETPEQCAVREFQEELGADPAEVSLLGRLSPIYIFGSNFHVTPCVGLTRGPLDFSPNPVEVAEVLEVPVSLVEADVAWGTHNRQRYGVHYRAPHLDACGHRVWGATCLILRELRALVNETQ